MLSEASAKVGVAYHRLFSHVGVLFPISEEGEVVFDQEPANYPCECLTGFQRSCRSDTKRAKSMVSVNLDRVANNIQVVSSFNFSSICSFKDEEGEEDFQVISKSVWNYVKDQV